MSVRVHLTRYKKLVFQCLSWYRSLFLVMEHDTSDCLLPIVLQSICSFATFTAVGFIIYKCAAWTLLAWHPILMSAGVGFYFPFLKLKNWHVIFHSASFQPSLVVVFSAHISWHFPNGWRQSIHQALDLHGARLHSLDSSLRGNFYDYCRLSSCRLEQNSSRGVPLCIGSWSCWCDYHHCDLLHCSRWCVDQIQLQTPGIHQSNYVQNNSCDRRLYGLCDGCIEHRTWDFWKIFYKPDNSRGANLTDDSDRSSSTSCDLQTLNCKF